jgi:hypothetical protein
MITYYYIDPGRREPRLGLGTIIKIPGNFNAFISEAQEIPFSSDIY